LSHIGVMVGKKGLMSSFGYLFQPIDAKRMLLLGLRIQATAFQSITVIPKKSFFTGLFP